ncbi:MFS transporter [Dellaglioa carnosa]|uniref:MFS transporter n=1 Tax=Dellaglioa carnosa TaxID=2995136 RepID=UPI0022A86881|nr:MFS transporter [Dellaglioa carnosa]MCZ2492867.1 MFS transporter [Dellaglioa carnosa]
MQAVANKKLIRKFLLGFGSFAVFQNMGFYMIAAVLMPQRLKDIGISNPDALLGTISAAGAMISLFVNVFVGAMSDQTRSRLGKRTPWYLAGGLISAISFYCIGIPSTGLGVLIAYSFANIGQNMMTAPIVATISDVVPEKNRGLISAAYGGGITVGQAMGTLLGSILIFNTKSGFFIAAILYTLASVLAFVFLPKEEATTDSFEKKDNIFKVLVYSFTPPIKNSRDFWLAFTCRTSLIVAYQMIAAYQLYILENYIGQTKQVSASIISMMSIITMIVAFGATVVSGPLSDKIGRRKPPIIISCILYGIGILMPLIFPSILGMLLFAGIAGLGYGMYMAVDQALNIDVLPNKKDAGKDLGFLNIASCAGQAVGAGITSTIVTVTGSYTVVFPVAIFITLIAVVSVWRIKGVR